MSLPGAVIVSCPVYSRSFNGVCAVSMVILGIVVLGSLIFIFLTLFSYFEQSTPLARQIQELRAGIAQKQQRLGEYQNRVELLQEELPALRSRCDRLEKWAELLKDQKARVEGEYAQRNREKAEERSGIIHRGLTGR